MTKDNTNNAINPDDITDESFRDADLLQYRIPGFNLVTEEQLSEYGITNLTPEYITERIGSILKKQDDFVDEDQKKAFELLKEKVSFLNPQEPVDDALQKDYDILTSKVDEKEFNFTVDKMNKDREEKTGLLKDLQASIEAGTASVNELEQTVNKARKEKSSELKALEGELKQARKALKASKKEAGKLVKQLDSIDKTLHVMKVTGQVRR